METYPCETTICVVSTCHFSYAVYKTEMLRKKSYGGFTKRLYFLRGFGKEASNILSFRLICTAS